MDRREASAEDLAPLELRELRLLDLHAPSAPGRAAHVSAASGVVCRGDFVYVIGDDELNLAVFEMSRRSARPAGASAGRGPARGAAPHARRPSRTWRR